LSIIRTIKSPDLYPPLPRHLITKLKGSMEFSLLYPAISTHQTHFPFVRGKQRWWPIEDSQLCFFCFNSIRTQPCACWMAALTITGKPTGFYNRIYKGMAFLFVN
jgi:hypothetical protein